jgi:uncharacterized membrane protein
MRGSACLLAAFLVVAAFGGSGARASATAPPLHICNRSQYEVTVAAGYPSSGPDDHDNLLTGPFVSLGWWVLEPGECVSVPNPFSARYMYWTGYKTEHGLFWNDGDAHFCVPNTAVAPPRFTFERQNESEDACVNSAAYASGGPNQWVPARQVDVSVDPDADYDGS